MFCLLCIGHYLLNIRLVRTFKPNDVSPPFPDREIGIKKFTRRLRLDRRTGNVRISDAVEIQGTHQVAITLYTAAEPRSFSQDRLTWDFCTLKTRGLRIVSAAEERRLDSDMKINWGRLWRIELVGTVSGSGGWDMDFIFSDSPASAKSFPFSEKAFAFFTKAVYTITTE